MTTETTTRSAILELNIYAMRREIGELEGDAEVAMDHAFEIIRKYKQGEENIIDLATKLARYSAELVETITAGYHAHNWTQSTAQELTLALNSRESQIEAVKVSLYLLKAFAGEELADRVRTAVFGEAK